MLNRILTTVIVTFSLLSCSNEESLVQPDLSLSGIVGKWKLTEAYVSPGGETTWQTVEDGFEYTFGANGSFSSNAQIQCDGNYDLDGENINVIARCEGSEVDNSYTLIIMSQEENELVLTNQGCIEECIYKFKKLK